MKLPRVFVGIPIGPTKLYSTYYMIASIRNLDYPYLDIHFAVTGGEDNVFEDYRQRLQKMVEAVKWPDDWTIEMDYLPLPLEKRMQNYGPILENKNLLRQKFLDSEDAYFLLLGGDNPPPRNAVKLLMSTNADIAMGVCYQRPGVTQCGVYPLVWRYLYSLKDIEECDCDEANKDLMRRAWLDVPQVISISYDSEWKKQPLMWDVTGGDGCALISRRTLETIDWAVRPPEGASCSEDMYFMGEALYYGYSTVAITGLHIAHMAESGLGV